MYVTSMQCITYKEVYSTYPETKAQAGEVWYVGRKLFWGGLGSKSAGSIGTRMVSSRHYTALLHKKRDSETGGSSL